MIPLKAGSTIGILGGGQLGRYFVMAARTMGYRVTVLEPDASSPAGAIADVHIVAAYDDADALEQLASTCAAVTIEFENAPASALATIAHRTVVHPSPEAIAICQDRIAEKQFLEDIGARDVAGHQVGRELDAGELHVQGPGQRRHGERLGQPRNADRQAVAAGEDADEHLLDHLALPDDHLVDLGEQHLPGLGVLK